MKNILKKVAFVLSFALVFAAMPMSVFAAEVTVTDAASLKEKLAAGNTVKLDANITCPTTGGLLTIPNGVSAVLDLNGHKIDAEAGRGYIISVEEGGSLVINATNGGEIINTNGYAIVNYGTLVVNGGTISGNYALYNGKYTSAAATATLNGGTFKSYPDNGYAIANCANMTVAGAVIEDWFSTSGNFSMTSGDVENFIATSADATVASGVSTNISGGSVDYLNVYTDGSVVEENNVAISNGTITEFEVETASGAATTNTVNITGGEFTSAAAQAAAAPYVAPGSTVGTNGAVVPCDHSMATGWAVTTPATCTAAGTETATCTCGTVVTRATALAAHPFGGWYTVKEPSCWDAGYEARVCSACGATESSPLAATSHNYDVNGVCAGCGFTKDGVATVVAEATGTSAPSRVNPNTGVHF